MATDRLRQLAYHTAPSQEKHPLDPLSTQEILDAVSVLRREKGRVFFNTVTLSEPPKSEVQKWLDNPTGVEKPTRVAEVVAVSVEGEAYDALVDLSKRSIIKLETLHGLQPLIIPDEMMSIERILRQDPGVIEQCSKIGIPPEDMDKVYCDPWGIGYDERYGSTIRLQQGILYYRPHLDDCQYTFPLDFCPIFDVVKQKVIDIEVPPVRRKLNTAKPGNYFLPASEYRTDLKPIHITQPEGVSFKVKNGRTIEWQNWSVHIGFNHREGIVLNNITFYDKFQNAVRPLFYRLSLAEMVVPYGNPEHPHQRKHAFDIGEYGAGNLTNSLALGCDCKGAIYYMDADLVTRDGGVRSIKNAICVHEEDDGILFKHTDFRDDSTIVTRARKLIISHIFTAANYEYCIYWIFHQDGTIQLEVKLTGILNTFCMNPGEDTHDWGNEVYPGVNAHNHQHIFCLRVDPNIDGPNNTVFQVDSMPSADAVGSQRNKYGNAFHAQRTKLSTAAQAVTDYDSSTGRTWDISNENVLNRHSHKPVSYKLVSREIAPLLPKKDSLAWRRAGFARNAIHVTKYDGSQLYPAGRHVPQNPGVPSLGLPEWIAKNPAENVANTDIVLWHTFGITHFATPEDFPIMPSEKISLLLRPRNFFESNPCMDVPPSHALTPTEAAAGKKGHCSAERRESVLV